MKLLWPYFLVTIIIEINGKNLFLTMWLEIETSTLSIWSSSIKFAVIFGTYWNNTHLFEQRPYTVAYYFDFDCFSSWTNRDINFLPSSLPSSLPSFDVIIIILDNTSPMLIRILLSTCRRVVGELVLCSIRDTMVIYWDIWRWAVIFVSLFYLYSNNFESSHIFLSDSSYFL